jgi:cytochrome c oxidase assembly factor CtaG
MKLLLGIFVSFLLFLGIGIGYFATKLYNKSVFLGFITTLMGIIVPFCLFIGFIYLYGLYNNGYPLQFKW